MNVLQDIGANVNNLVKFMGPLAELFLSMVILILIVVVVVNTAAAGLRIAVPI